MARRRSFAPRRPKIWDSIPSLSQDLNADGTYIASGILTPEANVTVMRVLGEYLVTFDIANDAIAAGDNVQIGLGLAVVSADAATAGAASMPDPLGEAEFPWLLWRCIDLYAAEAEGGTVFSAANGSGCVRWTFDSKVQRKMRPRESLLWIAQYAQTTGAPHVRVAAGQTRVLLAT